MTDPVATRIVQTFNDAFLESHHALMRGGAAEPLYEPAVGATPAQIVFTHDYPASALHEAAHWCLAGPLRRARRDYGYWYVPGPRDRLQREAFFRAEADVQALEAIFARACGVRFVVSADDFDASAEELQRFQFAIAERLSIRQTTLPRRAHRFRAALAAAFIAQSVAIHG
jgi:elongation factor P hydroxylase